MDELKVYAGKIREWMDAHRQELVDFTMEMMRIESTTYHEGEAVAWLKAKMEEFGYDEVRVDSAGNLIGRAGSGPCVVLADAHIDTVEPGDPKDWGFDPLEPRIIDGHIWGRGIVDDKGCLAALVFAGRALKELALDHAATFWVSSSIAEEDVEGSCVRAMMEEFSDIQPHMILVAEASGNRIIRGHKGRALISMEVTGKAAHASAAWRGENALIKSLPLMQAVDDLKDLPEDPVLGKGTIEVTNVDCDTPSLNTIPGKVTITADRRISCGESREALINELKPFLDGCGAKAWIDVERITTYTGKTIEQEDFFPSWILPEEHPVIQSACSAYQAVHGETPSVGTWDFCTNACYLCGITGIPSVGFGPGDEGLCHSTEERLSIQELTDAASVYASVVLSYALQGEDA